MLRGLRNRIEWATSRRWAFVIPLMVFACAPLLMGQQQCSSILPLERTYSLKTFWPMKEGNSWTFGTAKEPATLVFLVTEVLQINGFEVFKVRVTPGDMDRFYVYADDWLWYTDKETDLFALPDTSKFTKFLPENLAPGASHVNPANDRSYQYFVGPFTGVMPASDLAAFSGLFNINAYDDEQDCAAYAWLSTATGTEVWHTESVFANNIGPLIFEGKPLQVAMVSGQGTTYTP